MASSETKLARTDVDIVQRTEDHFDGFHRALDVVARERKYLTMLEAPPLAQARAFVRNAIAAGEPQFVALAQGTVVGWCDIRRHAFPTHAHRGTVGMGVVPSFRERGLGRRLLDATLQKAFSSGFTRVELHVHADNPRAIALYESVGFAREGVLRDAVFIDGVYLDAIAMALIRRGG